MPGPDPVAELRSRGELRLVPMEARHLDEVLAIEERSFASPWRREHFEFEIEQNAFAECWVLEVREGILAYLVAWRVEHELKINNVAVHPDQRGRGLGRFLLRRILRRAASAACSRATLEVRESNRSARRLYAGLGFVDVGRRKGYYQAEREDAILMELDLREPRLRHEPADARSDPERRK